MQKKPPGSYRKEELMKSGFTLPYTLWLNFLVLTKCKLQLSNLRFFKVLNSSPCGFMGVHGLLSPVMHPPDLSLFSFQELIFMEYSGNLVLDFQHNFCQYGWNGKAELLGRNGRHIHANLLKPMNQQREIFKSSTYGVWSQNLISLRKCTKVISLFLGLRSQYFLL